MRPRGARRARARRAGAELMRRLASPSVEPTFHSRYECKYLVHPMVVPEMRAYLRPFVEPDAFAARCRGYRYPICSLYLDSEDLLLYQQTVGGEKDRFKLRVRSYTDDPSKPVFFEVKRKSNVVVHKRRAALRRDAAEAILRQRPFDRAGLDEAAGRDIDYFQTQSSLLNARPLVRVKYMREAYQASGNEPVRITIDTELQHAITLDSNLSHETGRWTTTPVDGVIIEVKFTERYPWWVQQFIQAFGLKQQAVPKYVMSVDHMMMEGRESTLAVAGVTMPPRRV